MRYQKFDQLLYFDVNGWLTFNSTTSGPTGDDVGSDSVYPDYFLGLANSFVQGSAQHELVRSKSFYLFAQDSWKIKPNLTLNYGVRWEMNTPLSDIGQKVQTSIPGQRSTIYPCALAPGSDLLQSVRAPERRAAMPQASPPSVWFFLGDKGVPNGLTNTYYKAFAPRLGLNWSPGLHDGVLAKLTGGPGKTSISMGFGMFYNPIEQLVLEQFSAEPPFGGSNFIGSPFLQTPYVDQTGAVFSNPFTGILNPKRGTPLDWSNFRWKCLLWTISVKHAASVPDQYNLQSSGSCLAICSCKWRTLARKATVCLQPMR